MTSLQKQLLRVIAETNIKNEIVALCLMGGPIVTLRDIEIDEEAGLLCGVNLMSWPKVLDDGPVAKTFTCRIDAVIGFFA